MSPNRVTMTRAEAIRRRREEEQKRREDLVKKTISLPKLQSKPKPEQTHPAPNPVKAAGSPLLGRHSRRYDIAMSTPYGRAEAKPAPQSGSFSMPKIDFGARWLSLLLIALCGTALYFITSDSFFMVNAASIQGNNRVGADQISSVLGVMGKPAALLNPAQIEYNVLATFPDIASVHVEVNLPADVVVSVSERRPVAAWQENGQVVWVDAQGYAFPPRGFVEGLVTVSSAGAPPAPTNVDMTQVVGARPFLNPDMAMALMTLSPYVPQGASLVYDPRYGLGWTDPRGWQAYFGNSTGNVNTKLLIYQGMVDFLAKQGITPKLISVEYPDAPFYRTEN